MSEINELEYKGTITTPQGNIVGNYIYLYDPEIHQEILDEFCQWFIDCYNKDNRFFIVVDLETNGLYPKKNDILLHSISWNGNEALIFKDYGFNLDLYYKMLSIVKVANQNIKFDAKFWLQKGKVLANIFFDTMVACQLGYNSSFPMGKDKKAFGLGNIVSNLLPGYVMNKSIRQQFVGRDYSDDFTQEEIEYAVVDSLLTYKLIYPLTKRLVNQNLWDIYINQEIPVLKEFVISECHGIPVDFDRLQLFYSEKKAELEEKLEELNKIVARDCPSGFLNSLPKQKFNPNSPQQIPKVLKEFGIFVSSTGLEDLSFAFSNNYNEFLGKVIEYKELHNLVNKQIKKWIEEQVDLDTNRIYSNFGTCHTVTGRMNSYDPNMQQVKGDNRGFVKVPDGKSLIGLDMSAFEFRACAAATNEKYLIDGFVYRQSIYDQVSKVGSSYGKPDPDDFVKAVTSGKINITSLQDKELVMNFANSDIHRRNAALMLDKDISSVTPVDRTIAKCVDLNTKVCTTKGIKTLRELLPKRLKEDTYYKLNDINVTSDIGVKNSPEIYYNGKKPTLKITTNTGRQIVSTNTHKYRTIKSDTYVWSQASELSIGNTILVKTGYSSFSQSKFHYEKIEEKSLFLFLIYFSLNKSRILENGIKSSECINSFCKENPKYFKKVKDCLYLDSKFSDYCNKTIENENFIFSFDWNNLEWNLILKYLSDNSINLKVFGNIKTLENLHLCLSLIGYRPFLERDVRNSIHGVPFVKCFSDKVTIESCVYKDLRSKYINQAFSSRKYYELLNPSEKKMVDFLFENSLIPETIVSIVDNGEMAVGDLSVPEDNTLIYNGIVSHNTLGYAVLYGSGISTIKQQLAKEKLYFDDSVIKKFITIFGEKLSLVSSYIDEVHKFIELNHYSQSPLGRKRFYSFPPKWKAGEYRLAMIEAKRQGVNQTFQSANVDAIKIAITGMMEEFRDIFKDEKPLPVPILQIHDEVVLECDKEIDLRVLEIFKRWMVYGGEVSTMNKVPIEVSGGISSDGRWSK